MHITHHIIHRRLLCLALFCRFFCRMDRPSPTRFAALAMLSWLSLADRARPTEDLRFEEIVTEAGIYPSGHVVYGVLVFGMIGYLAYMHMRPGIWRTSLIIFMAALAILMGPSRVIELDHWPADTVGSYLLSVPFLLALIWIDRHPVSRPGGWLYQLFARARIVEDAVRARLFPGRH